MRGVDRDRVGLPGLASQFGEDAVEHAQPVPADEVVVDGLVRAVALGRIPPHQPMLDDVDDPGHDPPIIYPRNAMRKREKRLDPAHLRLAQQKWASIDRPPSPCR